LYDQKNEKYLRKEKANFFPFEAPSNQVGILFNQDSNTNINGFDSPDLTPLFFPFPLIFLPISASVKTHSNPCIQLRILTLASSNPTTPSRNNVVHKRRSRFHGAHEWFPEPLRLDNPGFIETIERHGMVA
jgi:hypothetical protein